MSIQATAEHEAAHAVVARYYRVPVRSVRINPRTLAGRTECDKTTPWQTAVILAAGDLWCRELSAQPYEAGRACSDLRRFQEEFSFDRLWSAEREAKQILTLHADAVRALARRLRSEEVIRFAHAPY